MAPSASAANAHAPVARKSDDLSDDGSSLLDEDVLQQPTRPGAGARAEVRHAWTDAAPAAPASSFFGERPAIMMLDNGTDFVLSERIGFSRRTPSTSAAYTTLHPTDDDTTRPEPAAPASRIPISRTGQFFYLLREMFLSSRLNMLVFFVPVGAVLYFVKANPAVVFIVNAIAIVPLSALLTDATERIANDSGDTIGALLNISLGNLVELIIL